MTSIRPHRSIWRRLALSLGILALLIAVAAIWTDRRADAREAGNLAGFPPVGQFVTLAGGERVHAVVRGSGPDLILIHGAGGNLRDYSIDLLNRLADDYRVIAFDRPGHGYTDRLRGYGGLAARGEGPEAQAAMLHEAGLQLGVKNPIIVGHSFGGAVAMAWALNYDPAALVTLAGVSHPWDTGLDWTYDVNGSAIGGVILPPLVSAFATEKLIQQGLANVFAPNPVPVGYRAYFGPELTIRAASQRANAQQVKALLAHVRAMAPRYPDLTLPIEVIHGSADTIVYRDIHAEAMAARVASANLTVLDGVGHMPNHADPETVIAAIHRAATRAGLR